MKLPVGYHLLLEHAVNLLGPLAHCCPFQVPYFLVALVSQGP